MTTKKNHIPSVRALRDAISRLKKEHPDTSITHFRVTVLKNSWMIEGGSNPLMLADFDGAIAQTGGFTRNKGSNSHHTAQAVVERLRAQVEGHKPNTPPPEPPEEVQEGEAYDENHPLIKEAREAAELKEDWEPPAIMPRGELDAVGRELDQLLAEGHAPE